MVVIVYGSWIYNYKCTYAISAYHYYLVVSSNPAHGEVYSIQHYVITFVSDLRHASGFL